MSQLLHVHRALQGIGKTLDPAFNFASVASPYAQELLDLQDGAGQRGFLLDTLQVGRCDKDGQQLQGWS